MENNYTVTIGNKAEGTIVESKSVVKLAERLREAMQKKGYKAAVLSEKTGIDRGSISHYLSGRYSPKSDRIYLMAKELGVSVAWLNGYDVADADRPDVEKPNQRKTVCHLTDHEIVILRKYAELDKQMKKIVDIALSIEEVE